MKKEETLLGIKIHGKWHEVTAESERICDTLKKHLGEDRVKEFDEWRPQEDEEIDSEVKERTIKKAQIDKDDIEEEGVVKETKEGIEEIKGGRTRKGFRKLFKCIKSTLRTSFRFFERLIYGKIISKFNPLFFECEEVDSSIEKKGDEYVMEIEINNDEVREKTKEEVMDSDRDSKEKS